MLRTRSGLLTPEQAWKQLDAGFARGRAGTPANMATDLKQASRRMGETRDYMRVYWSGTAYWLAADIELRRSGTHPHGIDDVLRRFDACCLPGARAWSPAQFVAKLDELAARDVFAPLYREYRARRDFPDIAPLYRALGMRRAGDALRFDDGTEAADMRDAIMRMRSSAGRVE